MSVEKLTFQPHVEAYVEDQEDAPWAASELTDSPEAAAQDLAPEDTEREHPGRPSEPSRAVHWDTEFSDTGVQRALGSPLVQATDPSTRTDRPLSHKSHESLHSHDQGRAGITHHMPQRRNAYMSAVGGRAGHLPRRNHRKHAQPYTIPLNSRWTHEPREHVPHLESLYAHENLYGRRESRAVFPEGNRTAGRRASDAPLQAHHAHYYRQGSYHFPAHGMDPSGRQASYLSFSQNTGPHHQNGALPILGGRPSYASFSSTIAPQYFHVAEAPFIPINPFDINMSHSPVNIRSSNHPAGSSASITRPVHYPNSISGDTESLPTDHLPIPIAARRPRLRQGRSWNRRAKHLAILSLQFILVKIPQQIYLYLLLSLPSFYFSRVTRLFEDANLSDPDIRRMARATPDQWKDGTPGSFPAWPAQFSEGTVSPHLLNFRYSWEGFINSLLREWKTQNVISALMLSAILTMLQINAAAVDPISRTTALISLICALMSLLFGSIYIIRFGTMRKMYKAAGWADEAQNGSTSPLWNVWILLAIPSAWLAWSIVLFITCVMAFAWRTGAVNDPNNTGLTTADAQGLRISITVVLAVALMHFFLIVSTFRRYGETMDNKWKQKMKLWALEAPSVRSVAPHHGRGLNVPFIPPEHPTFVVPGPSVSSRSSSNSSLGVRHPHAPSHTVQWDLPYPELPPSATGDHACLGNTQRPVSPNFTPGRQHHAPVKHNTSASQSLDPGDSTSIPHRHGPDVSCSISPSPTRSPSNVHLSPRSNSSSTLPITILPPSRAQSVGGSDSLEPPFLPPFRGINPDVPSADLRVESGTGPPGGSRPNLEHTQIPPLTSRADVEGGRNGPISSDQERAAG